MKSAMKGRGGRAHTYPHGIYCRAKGCKNSNRNCCFSFFGFPRDDSRLASWIAYAGRPEYADLPPEQLKHRKLCAVHFAADAFANKQRTSLKRTAVPCVPRETASSSAPVLSGPSSSSGDPTPTASDSHTSGVEDSISKDLWETNREEWRVPQQDSVCSKHFLESGFKGGPRISPKQGAVPQCVFVDTWQKLDMPRLIPGNLAPTQTTETVIYVTLNETDDIMPLDSRNDSTSETDKGVAETLQDCVQPVTNIIRVGRSFKAQMNVASGHNYSKSSAHAPLNPSSPSKLGKLKSLIQNCRRQATTIERLRRQKNELKQKLRESMKREQIYSLKEVESDMKEGSERAAFLLDQLQNYKRKSPRWSETTIHHCILWSSRLHSRYSVIQSSKALKLPSIATLKKYVEPTNTDSAMELAVTSLLDEVDL